VTEYSLFIFIFLILANFCTHQKKKTLMQRHRNQPSNFYFWDEFFHFWNLKNMICTDTIAVVEKNGPNSPDVEK
jgi:hypothetical protein